MRLDGWHYLHLTLEADGRVLLLEFDHGKANEMGTGPLQELERLAQELASDSNVMSMITWSRRTSRRGTPIFVAGANVTERSGWSDEQVKKHVRWQREVLCALRAAPVFHIGVVGGVALGWGTEYLLLCDYGIAGPDAIFALPETGLGIVPGAGGTANLWGRVGAAQALRLGMTGERIGATEALRIGLVQEAEASLDDALQRARRLAEMVTRRSPTAVAAFKAGVYGAIGRPEVDRLRLEGQAYAQCVDSGEAAIGRAHFTEIIKGGFAPWGERQEESQ
jgi:enoyl-CoA hydratase/carnithine racemase